jgi:hypothetical protein
MNRSQLSGEAIARLVGNGFSGKVTSEVDYVSASWVRSSSLIVLRNWAAACFIHDRRNKSIDVQDERPAPILFASLDSALWAFAPSKRRAKNVRFNSD